MRCWTGVLLVVVGGCGGPVRTEVPIPQLCVMGTQTESASTFPAAQPVTISLGVDPLRTCRPACDTVVESRCSLTRDGNTFRVQGRFVVDVDCHGQSPLPVCSTPRVDCVTPPLDAGEYVVTDGAQTLSFRVPSSVSTRRLCAP